MGQWRNGSEATKTDANGTEAIAEAMGQRRNDNEATEVDTDGTEAIAKASITMGQQKNEGEATKTDANGLVTTEVDDLESILRQKALENFKKFRDSAKRQVMKGDENDENNDAKRVISKPISKTISIRSEIVRVSHDIIDITTNPSVNSTSVGGSVRLSEEGCNLKEPKPLQESSNNVLLEGVTNEKIINKQGSGGGGGDARVAKADGRSSPPPNGAAICNNPVMSGEQQKVETKDGSEFQQKTMSVMRGGEAVQVSYKVYIPKKAPALARRQLQR
ncbi:hypothetical protein QJS10_CPA01g00583 [Acorus calamus]|uniref:Uncharacterized protein n=1 Tax=Acorus calamus TaxID=4465 RepID=A0AAV9FQT4_ACOCL|nr:hypothetical protein QJS10_CPA01g00583 [Acorus calamus]